LGDDECGPIRDVRPGYHIAGEVTEIVVDEPLTGIFF
jgi:hypothetical protein